MSPAGPGKYDDECAAALEKTGGGVLLIVFDGRKGSGFSIKTTLPQLLAIPRVLRDVADQIERDLATKPDLQHEIIRQMRARE